MTKIIKHQLFYPNPPEDVWEYLTNAELIAQWMMPSNFLPVEGHEFQFRAKPMPELDFDGIFHCKVLEVIPFKKLSYSWRFGPGNGILHNSVVNWTLNEKDNGTDLLLIHNGFEGAAILPMFLSMEDGWLKLIQKLLQLISPPDHGTKPA